MCGTLEEVWGRSLDGWQVLYEGDDDFGDDNKAQEFYRLMERASVHHDVIKNNLESDLMLPACL